MENGELSVQLGVTGLEFNRRSQFFSLAAEWKSTCLHVPLGNQLLELSVVASIHQHNDCQISWSITTVKKVPLPIHEASLKHFCPLAWKLIPGVSIGAIGAL